MTSHLLINNLKLSFIWVETFSNLFDRAVCPPAPLAFMGDSDLYRIELAKVQNQTRTDIQLPWLSEQKGPNFFWIYYLMDTADKGPVDLSRLSESRVWKQLVPFCSHTHLPRVKAPWLGKQGYVSLEAFYYPHGLALVVTTGCRKQLTPAEVVDTAFKIRYQEKFDVHWQTGTEENLDLHTLANKCLNTLGKMNLGLDDLPVHNISPFTVLTVVQGFPLPVEEIPANGEIHQMLEAVTVWRRINPGVTLQNLNQAWIRFDPACFPAFSPPNLLYHHKRSRAVWFPCAFSDTTRRKRRTLNCYHKNLVIASLQIESLSGLVALAAQDIKNGNPLVSTYEVCAKRAVGILRRLYGGVNTYQSPSIPVQIEENHYDTDIENVTRELVNCKDEEVPLTRNKC